MNFKKIIDNIRFECIIISHLGDWSRISESKNLPIEFIRRYSNKIDWLIFQTYNILSEDFIREFKYCIDWHYMSKNQKLSESFIREFQNLVDWACISQYQKLTENFIREFKHKVCWCFISFFQELSEQFIEEMERRLDFRRIYVSQNLSPEFLQKHQMNVKMRGLDYYSSHEEKTYEQKLKEVKEYAIMHNLKVNGKYLYAYRKHDGYGRGFYNNTISYKKNEYYRDWHCDMRENEKNSFGLGIWPEGNTKVRIKIEDWGVCVDRSDGKARVWGFEII